MTYTSSPNTCGQTACRASRREGFLRAPLGCARHGFQLIRVENSYARRYHFMKYILVAYFKGK
jgi:hypothetical protein